MVVVVVVVVVAVVVAAAAGAGYDELPSPEGSTSELDCSLVMDPFDGLFYAPLLCM